MARKAVVLAVSSILMVGCCWRGSAATFDATDFQGSYDSPPLWLTGPAGTEFVGDIVFAKLARSVVESILPDDLKLATNTGPSPGVHPIVVVFGAQTHLALFNTLTGLPDYHEVMLLVPFVLKKNGGTKFHNYVVRMYLTWQDGVDLGNLNAGLRKEFADINFITPLPDVSLKVVEPPATGTEMFHAQASGQSAWMNESAATTALTNFNAMKTIFQMPILGTYPYGGYVCSHFVWDFSDPATQIRRSKSSFQVLKDLVPYMNQWVALGPVSNDTNGAFGVDQLKWLVTYSLPCNF